MAMCEDIIKMITKRAWKVMDREKIYQGLPQREYETEIPPGTYNMIRAPFLMTDGRPITWLCIAGTTLGGAEGYWQQWEGSKWNDFEVVLIEENPLPSGVVAPL